jgi:hypothetical protein
MGGRRCIAGGGNSFSRSYNVGFGLSGSTFSGFVVETLIRFLAASSVCAFRRRPSCGGVGVRGCGIYSLENIPFLVSLSSKILLISLSESIESKSKEGGTWASSKVGDGRRSSIVISGDGSLSESSFDDIYLLLCVCGSGNEPKKGICGENMRMKSYRNIHASWGKFKVIV